MRKIIPQSLKNVYHLFQAVFANICFGFPSRRLKAIGVTGTNGKTTTVQMVAKILEKTDLKVAVASTINFKIDKMDWVNATKFTTLSSWRLQKHLREAVRAGCEYAIIEVTSHALDQNRVWGVDFDVAVITNITREHLDYHETMEEYAKTKEKLFMQISKKIGGTIIVNLNMEFAENFLKYGADKKYGYFLETQNPRCLPEKDVEIVIARNIEKTLSGSEFMVERENFILQIPGEFNIENALAAVCTGLSQRVSLEKISSALGELKGVPGRMENIENSQGLNILVDYAVTPDSLEKLYTYLEGTKKEGSKIIAVFGSCGERDRGKRPIMGEIVAKHTDYAIVTNEDPYGEDPVSIVNEIFRGVVGHKVEEQIPNFQFSILNFQTNPKSQDKKIQNTKYKIPDTKTEGVDAFRILDRREAIKTALQIAKPGDIVVVTGKGAEEMMAVGNKRIPWNDPKVIREVLQELG